MLRKLRPHLLGYMLSGGVLALPGACADLLLSAFGWSAADFGMAITIQGLCAFLGSRMAGKRAVVHDLKHQARQSLAWGCLGTVLFYFSDWTLVPILAPLLPMQIHKYIPLLGIVAIGVSVGANGIFNNTAGMQLEQRPRALNLLNLAFTVGATLVPVAATAYLNLASASLNLASASLNLASSTLNGAHSPSFSSPLWSTVWWRLPAGALVFCYLFVVLYAFPNASLFKNKKLTVAAPTQQAEPDVSHVQPHLGAGLSPRLPVVLLSLVLFCYVGSEVNVSNGISLLNWKAFGFTQQQARVASPVFWSGLFAARLCASLANFRVESFGRILLAASAGCLTCFLLLMFQTFQFFPDPYFANLALVFSTGFFLGSIYGFGLGATLYFYTPAEASKNANTAALVGVAGSVLLPLLFGQVASHFDLYWSGALISVFMGVMLFASLGVALLMHKSSTSICKTTI